MSKQSEAKKHQNYNPKPEHACCANCESLTFDVEKYIGYGKKEYENYKNLRCAIGGFKVMKRGTCTAHKFRAHK
jgi:hypothetical protein